MPVCDRDELWHEPCHVGQILSRSAQERAGSSRWRLFRLSTLLIGSFASRSVSHCRSWISATVAASVCDIAHLACCYRSAEAENTLWYARQPDLQLPTDETQPSSGQLHWQLGHDILVLCPLLVSRGEWLWM